MTEEPTLFDLSTVYSRRVVNKASARNAIGECAAEFACAALRMTALPTDGSKKVCPDARALSGAELEVKSCRLKRNALLYKWRVEKELEAFGPSYPYVFVRHDCSIEVQSGEAIARSFIESPPSLLVVTLGELQEHVCSLREPRKFKLFSKEYASRYGRPAGFDRGGYADGGWQFSITKVPSKPVGTLKASWSGSEVVVRVDSTDQTEALFEKIFNFALYSL